MYKIEQQVIYGGNGVCKIEDVVLRDSHVAEQPQQMYVIRLASGLTSYVPVNSCVFMRELIGKEEALTVLREYPYLPLLDIPATNSKALSDLYRSILSKHDPRELLSLYKTLQSKVARALAGGKRPGAMDERFSAAALQEVTMEISVVLGRPQEDIIRKLTEQPISLEDAVTV